MIFLCFLLSQSTVGAMTALCQQRIRAGLFFNKSSDQKVEFHKKIGCQANQSGTDFFAHSM